MSWPVIKFSDAISRSGLFSDGDWVESKDQDPEGDVRLIQLADIGVGEFVDKSNRFMTSKRANELKCSYLKAGDILVARMPDPIGRACIFPEDMGRCVTVVDICIVRPDSERIDNRWLMHLINSERFRNQIDRHVTGTTRQRISRGNLAGLEIPLPPLPEQKRIAAILDKADAIRRKRQQAMQLADDFLRAIFLDMFGDPVTNPKGWPLKRFGDVGTWSSGGTPSRTVSDFFEGEINWYSAGELNSRYLDGSVEKISESAIKNSAAKIFKKDSLLVGMYDTAAMKISILKEDSSCNQACANVECNELASVEWLYSYISYAKDSYLSRRRGVRQKNLNLGMIRDFLLPLPPRDLQDEFVRFVSAVFDMKKKQDECKDFPVFESLSLKAFSGQL